MDVGEVEGANDPSDPFPTPEKLWTIDGDFGGWEAVNTKFFDEDAGTSPRSAGVRQLVTALAPTDPGTARQRRSRASSSLTRGSAIGLGLTLTWFSLLVSSRSP